MQPRERKRHRLTSIFRAKPNTDASKDDRAGRIAGGGSVSTAPNVPDILTEGMLIPGSDEGNHRKSLDAHVSPNESQNDRRKIAIAPAISTAATKAVRDSNRAADLWGSAYQDLKIREKLLVDAFERSITNIADPTADAEQTPFTHETIQKIVKQKIDARKAKRLSIHLGKYSVEFRAMGEKIIEGILWSSTFIGTAVSAQPYAALAWSGVSIILPLLLNNSRQNLAMIEGLEKITKLMQLFRIREEIYLQDVTRPLHPDFEAAVVQLYSAVFEYEARVIIHLADPPAKRAISGGWDTAMARIQDAKQHCEEFANLFDRSREAEQFASIKETLASLRSFREEHQRYRQEEKEASLLQILSSDYKGDKRIISERSDGTCEWFFHNQAFIDWHDSNMTSLLWVSGAPGCGKTVLSKVLIDEKLGTDNVLCSTVCYFFFNAGQERKELAADALSAILHQLFQSTDLISYGLASYKKHGAKLSQMFSDLWEILMDCAKDSEAGTIICVIDALDECEKESRERLLREITQVFSLKSKDQLVDCSLKLLVTSQPRKDIKDQFDRLSENTSYFHIDIDSHSDELGDDIDLVIHRQVKDFAGKFDSGKQQFIANHLKSRDKRTYLWLFLIADIIKESSIEYSKFPSVQKLLLDLPDRFSDAYNRILSRSKDPELAKMLLKIIIAATRPLTLTEANIALTIAMCHQQGMAYEELELWPSNDFPSILKDLCGLMVAVHDDKLSLFHSTVRKFLLAESGVAHPNATPQLSIKDSVGNAPAQRDWAGCLDISNAHGLMCQICLNYLTLSNFAIPSAGLGQNDNYDSDNDDNDDDEKRNGWSFELVDCNGETTSLYAFVEESLKKYAFLDYSALSWPYHYREQDQQHRSILRVDAEIMCDPSSVFFVNWATISSIKGGADFISGCDGLGIASYHGLTDLVEKFSLSVDDIDAYQPLYPADFTKDTALRIAIQRGFPDVVRVLLERKADSSLHDENGDSPLKDALSANFLAPLSDRVAILQMLFDSGLDINSKIVNGNTPLYYASLFSTADVVRFLIQKDASLEAPTGLMNWTTLQEAILNGHETQTAILLEYDADLNAHAISKNTVFGEAGKFSSVVI